jgi:hypothetical protein
MMPVEEKELDEIVEPHWRRILESMEKRKFYSINEMSEKIIGKKLYERDALLQYLPHAHQGKRFVPNEEMLSAIVAYVTDMAYVESFLVSQIALENLRQGRKNGVLYFGRRHE